ncbi:MAG: hypothetical protein IH596_05270 [Bacteroidales bacterium]|nr:hypothetical protein [Bacteroidales bacterium]
MKKSFLSMLVVVGAVMMLTTSCAKLPQEELDAANASVEAAKAVEAQRYLAADFNALQDSLNKAMTMIETQKSKFSMMRSYKDAKALLVTVTTMAATLKDDAIVKKEEVKIEVQNALVETNSLVAEVKLLIAKAPRGKEGKAALEAIQTDLAGVEATLTEVATLIDNGDYMTAQEKVSAAKEKTNSLKAELEEAIAKTKRK